MGNKSKKRPQGYKGPKVSIGYCHSEQISSFFHSSLLALLHMEQHRVSNIIEVLSGPKVDHARNKIFSRWLKEGNTEYLLMVDTDMVLPVDTLSRLLKHDKDIVGGLCFSGMMMTNTVNPTLRIIDEEGIKIMWNYPINSLVQVAATGAACILVKRQVAEDMLEARGPDHVMPWFAFGMHNGVAIGEDVGFCLTAGLLGFEVWVDTSLVIPHVKPTFIQEEEYVVSLSNKGHEKYDDREDIPIYREIMNGHLS